MRIQSETSSKSGATPTSINSGASNDEDDDSDEEDEESEGDESAGGDKPKRPRTPRNLLRASKLRTKAGQFKQDLLLLDRWAKRDKSGDEGPVAKLREQIMLAQNHMELAATLYEEMPDSVVKGRGGGGGGDRTSKLVQPGVLVRVKDKFQHIYSALTGGAGLENLTVVNRTDSHVAVQLADGERFFVRASELEPMSATEQADDQPAAE